MHKTFILISALLSSLFISAAAYATQINLHFADDVKAHQDKLNAAVDVYYNVGSGVNENKFSVTGLAFDHVTAFAEQLATMFADKQLITNATNTSQISLGLIKDGLTIAPASCQNINVGNVSSISILLSESGCTVS